MNDGSSIAPTTTDPDTTNILNTQTNQLTIGDTPITVSLTNNAAVSGNTNCFHCLVSRSKKRTLEH